MRFDRSVGLEAFLGAYASLAIGFVDWLKRLVLGFLPAAGQRPSPCEQYQLFSDPARRLLFVRNCISWRKVIQVGADGSII